MSVHLIFPQQIHRLTRDAFAQHFAIKGIINFVFLFICIKIIEMSSRYTRKRKHDLDQDTTENSGHNDRDEKTSSRR